MADWVSARTLCATSIPTARSAATPNAPPPRDHGLYVGPVLV
jgi:hypothetical protein